MVVGPEQHFHPGWGARARGGQARCDPARCAGTGSGGDGHVGRQTVCELNTKPTTPWQLHARVTCFTDCGTVQSVSSLTFLLRLPSQCFAFTAAQLPKGWVLSSAAIQKLQRTDVCSGSEFSASQCMLLGGCQPPQCSWERGFCPLHVPQPHSVGASREEPRVVSHFTNPNGNCRLPCFNDDGHSWGSGAARVGQGVMLEGWEGALAEQCPQGAGQPGTRAVLLSWQRWAWPGVELASPAQVGLPTASPPAMPVPGWFHHQLCRPVCLCCVWCPHRRRQEPWGSDATDNNNNEV